MNYIPVRAFVFSAEAGPHFLPRLDGRLSWPRDVMGRDDSCPATVPSVVVISFSFSEAVHTTMHTMYTTKQAVPVECLDR